MSFSYFDESDVVRIIRPHDSYCLKLVVLTFKNKIDVVHVISQRIYKLERKLLQVNVHSKKYISSLCHEISTCFALLRALINLLPESYDRRVPMKTWKYLEEWENHVGIHTILNRIATNFGKATVSTWDTCDYDIEVFAAKNW